MTVMATEADPERLQRKPSLLSTMPRSASSKFELSADCGAVLLLFLLEVQQAMHCRRDKAICLIRAAEVFATQPRAPEGLLASLQKFEKHLLTFVAAAIFWSQPHPQYCGRLLTPGKPTIQPSPLRTAYGTADMECRKQAGRP